MKSLSDFCYSTRFKESDKIITIFIPFSIPPLARDYLSVDHIQAVPFHLPQHEYLLAPHENHRVKLYESEKRKIMKMKSLQHLLFVCGSLAITRLNYCYICEQ